MDARPTISLPAAVVRFKTGAVTNLWDGYVVQLKTLPVDVGIGDVFKAQAEVLAGKM